MVNEISQNRKTSVNRTYKIIEIAKSGHFYKRKRPGDSNIEKELSDLARKHPRWGFGKIFSYLRNKKLSSYIPHRQRENFDF